MQRYGQKTSKIPQKWGFSPICDPPRFFLKNRALSLLYHYCALTSYKKIKKKNKSHLYPYSALTSCKKLKKTNEQSLNYADTSNFTFLCKDGIIYYLKGGKFRGHKLSHVITFVSTNFLKRQCSNGQSQVLQGLTFTHCRVKNLADANFPKSQLFLNIFWL